MNAREQIDKLSSLVKLDNDALQSGEKLTNKDYGDAVNWDVPQSVHSMLQSNYEDEQRHLGFVTNAINDRVWGK